MSGPAILPLAVAVLGCPGDDARVMALVAQLGAARPLARASPCSTRARAARVFEPFDDLVSWTFPERTGP
jgi:hypothetical protein